MRKGIQSITKEAYYAESENEKRRVNLLTFTKKVGATCELGVQQIALVPGGCSTCGCGCSSCCTSCCW